MVVFPPVVVKGVHWTRDRPSLFIGLMGAMYLISPNTTQYDICKCATMWLWN